MNEFLKKLSSYNIFNYLLPGIIFVWFASKVANYNFVCGFTNKENIIILFFIFYFIGLIISRIGSLFIEPIFRLFIKYRPYQEFILASKIDQKLEVLLEQNNLYRTLVSLFSSLIFIEIFRYFAQKFKLTNHTQILLLIIFLLVIFVASYVKQTKYITERIKINLKNK